MDTNEKKTVSKTQLRDRYQEFMAAHEAQLGGNGEIHPGILSAMHAMFMMGASTVIGAIANCDEDTIDTVANSFCEELQDYAEKMQLVVMTNAGKAN